MIYKVRVDCVKVAVLRQTLRSYDSSFVLVCHICVGCNRAVNVQTGYRA